MPEHDEIKRLLGSSCMNLIFFLFFLIYLFLLIDLDYFCCLKIVAILKETEKDSKNMFGMYSSKRMKVFYSFINRSHSFFLSLCVFRIGEQLFQIMKEILSILVCFYFRK